MGSPYYFSGFLFLILSSSFFFIFYKYCLWISFRYSRILFSSISFTFNIYFMASLFLPYLSLTYLLSSYFSLKFAFLWSSIILPLCFSASFLSYSLLIWFWSTMLFSSCNLFLSSYLSCSFWCFYLSNWWSAISRLMQVIHASYWEEFSD